jgi:glutathione S-transferase
MTALSFENPVFRVYAVAAGILILKMASQSWITVYRMLKVNAGMRNPEDARVSPMNPHGHPGQLDPNEYVERSRRMHGNDVENIPIFLVAGLLYVCSGPGLGAATALFATYVVSRLAHFYVLMSARSHEARAATWTIGSIVIYAMTVIALIHALKGWV